VAYPRNFTLLGKIYEFTEEDITHEVANKRYLRLNPESKDLIKDINSVP
jgi:hypothetical protein